MQRQSNCHALSTEAMICNLGHPGEDQKMSMRDFVILAERLAVTLGACELVHVIM